MIHFSTIEKYIQICTYIHILGVCVYILNKICILNVLVQLSHSNLRKGICADNKYYWKNVSTEHGHMDSLITLKSFFKQCSVETI